MTFRSPVRAHDARRRAFVARICLLVWIVGASAGCNYRFASVEARTTPTHVQDPREVRAAVLRALADQHFDPVTEQPGQIYATLWRRKWTINVAVEYGSWQYAIRYVSSTGLPTRAGRDGQPLVHRRYQLTVDALSEQIRRELGLPMPWGLAAKGPPGSTTITTTTVITPPPGGQAEVDGEVVVEVPPH